MRAMRFDRQAPVESRPLACVEVPAPQPGPGEIRVRVRVCGICRTDLHVIEGDLPELRSPLVPGHQVVGIVDRRGPGASRFKEGDRVGIAWLRQTCGACTDCTRGNENLCRSSRYTGYHEDGGYAEFAVVPESFAYAIRPSFTMTMRRLFCARESSATGVQAQRDSRGRRAGLFGFGSSAHITLQLARHRGCGVFVVTRGEKHRRFALELGAEWPERTPADLPVRLDGAILFAPAGTWSHPRCVLFALQGRSRSRGSTCHPSPR